MKNATPGATDSTEASVPFSAEASGPRGLREDPAVPLLRNFERAVNQVINARVLQDEQWEEEAWKKLDAAWQALGAARRGQ